MNGRSPPGKRYSHALVHLLSFREDHRKAIVPQIGSNGKGVMTAKATGQDARWLFGKKGEDESVKGCHSFGCAQDKSERKARRISLSRCPTMSARKTSRHRLDEVAVEGKGLEAELAVVVGVLDDGQPVDVPRGDKDAVVGQVHGDPFLRPAPHVQGVRLVKALWPALAPCPSCWSKSVGVGG